MHFVLYLGLISTFINLEIAETNVRRAHKTHAPPTTHAPHTTKPHGHHQHQVHTTKEPSTLFKFDSRSLAMMAYKGDSCYFYVLKIEEYHHVNTPRGLREIETKIDSLIAGHNETLVPLGDLTDLSHEFRGMDRHCVAASKHYIIK